MAVDFVVEGETFTHEADAIEHARELARMGAEVGVWMRSGVWSVLIALCVEGVVTFPVPRTAGKFVAA